MHYKSPAFIYLFYLIAHIIIQSNVLFSFYKALQFCLGPSKCCFCLSAIHMSFP